MKSSSGAHYLALDHLRALAALLVITWHFAHGRDGYPVPFEGAPAVFPLAVFDEGHTGVALFMTLSGYLFARLLEGKAIDYRAFIWNRLLRLLPLLLVVILLIGLLVVRETGSPPWDYLWTVAQGVLLPTLPNGGWSITVEFHFYLVLPVLLLILKRRAPLVLLVVALGVALRTLLYLQHDDIGTLAYGTIIGRIDQFTLGILACRYRHLLTGRHVIAVSTLLAFVAFYWWFASRGGLIKSANDPIWIVLPTIEGAAYAVGIAWYETSFKPSSGPISRFVGRMGEYSYSIYLLHFFVVMKLSALIHSRVMPLSNLYVATLGAVLFACAMMIPGYLSYRFIESPFLRLRRRYVRERTTANLAVNTGAPGSN